MRQGPILLVLLVAALAGPSAAAASGPSLTVPPAQLAASLKCGGARLDGAARTPILLVHGTGVTAHENWSHFYEPALTFRKDPWCTVELPQRATGDIQVNAEY